MLDMMNAQQEELSKIVHVLQAGFENDIPHVSDANGVLLYPTLSRGTVAGLSLLVPMYPGFGEPISLCVNHCPTDIAVIRKKLTTKVIKREEKVFKPICIKDKLYNQAPYDFVGITAEAQLYFAPGSIKKKSRSSINKIILREDHFPGFLPT